MRYSFNTYKDIVLEELQDKLGEENVRFVEVQKNNGVKLQGLQLNMGTDMAAPVMYFHNTECYSDADVERFVEEAEKLFHSKETFSTEAVMAIRDWEIARTGLRAKVVNYEANKECLKDKPFVRFLDLAVIFVIATEGIVQGCEDGVITVNNSMMKFWAGVDEMVLHKEAIKNLEQSNYRVCSMSSLLDIMVFDNDESLADEKLCVATSYDGRNGACVILSPTILSEAIRRMQAERIYIIPSSVHEILLIDCAKVELVDLQHMVKDVNENFVDTQEILSDTIYIFEDGVVKIA